MIVPLTGGPPILLSPVTRILRCELPVRNTVRYGEPMTKLKRMQSWSPGVQCTRRCDVQMAALLWKQATLLKHQLPCRECGVGGAHMLHWWQEICPQHILHAAFALRVIRRCVQKTPGVCRLVLVCEREDLCSATQLMGKDGDAKESSTAQEVHEQVAGHMTSVKMEQARSACLRRLSFRNLRYLSVCSGCARSLHLSSRSKSRHSFRSSRGSRPLMACYRCSRAPHSDGLFLL